MTENKNAIKEAVNVAVIELLTNPEYGSDFVRECLNGEGVGDADVEEVTDLINRELTILAGSAVSNLRREKNIDTYFAEWGRQFRELTERVHQAELKD